MLNIPLPKPHGITEIATISPAGITVTGQLIAWETLSDAVYAASQCCREGSRKHDDLYQAAVDYIPSLKRRADELQYEGMDRPQ